MANNTPEDDGKMSIRIRFYTTDIDLISLYAAGYPISDMMRKAVIAGRDDERRHTGADHAHDQ